MIQVNVYEAKTHISRLLRRVKAGEEIVIAEAGKPVARLVPIAANAPRVLGGDEGKLRIADDFDAALPDDLIEAFYGGAPLAERSSKRKARSPKRRASRR